MGLEYSPEVTPAGPGVTDGEVDEHVKRRIFLAQIATAVMGSAIDFGAGQQGPRGEVLQVTPVPARVGMTDVERLQAASRTLGALADEMGGAAMRNAVLANVGWGRQLLGADCTDRVRLALLEAVGLAHRSAGWVSRDVGLTDSARYHYGQAVALAREAGNPGLLASAIENAARLEVTNGAVNEGLKLLQFAAGPAAEVDDPHLNAIVDGALARAYALLDRPALAAEQVRHKWAEAGRAVGRPSSQLARVSSADPPLTEGQVQVFLPRGNPDRAVALLETAVRRMSDEEVNRKAWAQISLATAYLRAGDYKLGPATAGKTVDTIERLRSRRLVTELDILRTEAGKHRNADCRDLANRIARLSAPKNSG